MDAKQFVQAYPRTLKPNKIHQGAHSAYIEEAQNWSYEFGRLLWALLHDEKPVTFTSRQFKDYATWRRGYQRLSLSLLASPDEAAMRARNEINFHGLNGPMIGLWRRLINGHWGSKDLRLGLIGQAQNGVALEGYFYYRTRQDMAERNGTHSLFEPAVKSYYERINGFVQELDAAVVLLDVVRRHPDWIVVPAPLQFERTNAQTNVDFVVIDLAQRRAVGVQVKTSVRQSHLNHADLDRVVFVDGNLDLNNVRAMRTQRSHSAQKVVTWPGLVSIKRISVMQTTGKTSALVLPNSFYATRTKQEAQRLVGNLNVDYHEMSTRIGERIAAKL